LVGTYLDYLRLMQCSVLMVVVVTTLGKTTLADSLVASNGIISHRQAGKVGGGCEGGRESFLLLMNYNQN